MAPSRNLHARTSGIERVRHELLTALHVGRLSPGDRVPSVRRLADRTGMNRKTVHRAYARLAREGLLDLRPGSGTFVSETMAREDSSPPLGELLVAANRCRAAAGSLGLTPRQFTAFLDIYLGGGTRDVPLAVVECNHEQLGLIGQDLRASLGAAVRLVLLHDLASGPESLGGRCRGIVTTDCHLVEVLRLAAPLGLPVYRLALDSAFPQRLAAVARTSDVLMIVRDRRFGFVFRRLLAQLDLDERALGRVAVLEPTEARTYLREREGEETTVCVSPTVAREMAGDLPRSARLLRVRWRVDGGSLDRLRARLALDLAVERSDDGA